MTDYLVGVDHHVKAMTSLLDISQKDVRVVGICGANGIGKTTIARVLYNQFSRLFESCIFLEDIRTKYEDLVHLQKELLSNFLKVEPCDIPTVNVGINLIKNKFQNKKVLIVLDDIDQRSQLNALAGKLHWFGVGSRVIVTTAKKYVLPTEAVAWIYEPTKMDSNESLQLLSKHAFRRNHPPRDYFDLSWRIASRLVGTPLSLKIIGSFLFGKNAAVWIEVEEKLTKSLTVEVEEKLKLNYEALDYQQRQIFLDIVHHFVGVDRRIAHYMWDDCGFYPGNGIELLRILSLVNIGDDSILRMDVEVKEKLGLTAKNYLLPDDLPNLRYYNMDNVNPNGNFDELFPKLRKLRWLRLNGCPPELSWASFQLQNLVILDLSWSKISDGWEGWNHVKVARKLKVLNLTGCDCLTTTPVFSNSVFPVLERLILQDCEKLAHIDPSIRYLTRLIYLNVKNCAKLGELPDLSSVRALLEIILDKTAVQNIHSIRSSKKLQTLSAAYCGSLAEISFTSQLKSLLNVAFDFAKIKKLPGSIGQLVNLRRLSLSYCSALEELPDSIGKLEALIELNLLAAGVISLPEDIGMLKHLRFLNLRSSSITELPTSIGMLEKLEHLDVSCCTDFKGELPSSIGKLYCLRILNFHDTRIDNLPASFGQLSSLQILDLGCENQNSSRAGITELPDSIGLLVDLQYLSLNNQRSLKFPKSIWNLESLVELNLEEIEYVELPETKAHLRNLRKLNMKDSYHDQCPAELPCVLRDLTLHCTGSSLLSSASLQNLRRLCLFSSPLSSSLEIPKNITECSKLEELTLKKLNISSLPNLPQSLLELRLENCASLKALPDLSNLEKLEHLGIENCTELEELEGLDKLESLRVLRVMGCKSLEVLPDLSKCRMLLELNLRNCEKLQDITGLDSLASLEKRNIPSLPNLPQSLLELRLENCASLKALPDLSNLEKLEHLGIENCTELEELEGLDKLESLHVLRVLGCKSLEVLPDLSNLEKLEHLGIENCTELEELEGLDKLKSLRVLRVMGCKSLEALPDLSKCQMLLELNLRNCEKLQEIKGLDSLASLEELDISFCKSLERLPNVSNLNMLKVFANKGLEALASSKKQKQTSAPIKKDLTISEKESSTASIHEQASSSFQTKTVIASTSSTPEKYDYQVFLSFRGKDTRKNFTDHLYSNLVAAGIRTFRDNEGLPVGELIGPDIPEIIEQSRILIPILSKNYASSEWCLMELTHMVKCMKNTQQIILPIFYDVTPSDVKHQTGAFEMAFLRHAKEFKMEIIEEWKEALKMVAELRGFNKDKSANGREGELVKAVVSKVCKKLKRSNVGEMEKFLNIDGLVGMDHHVKEMKKLLDINGSGVRIVGIHGMGGIGKTTIAKYMYNLLHDRFQQRCSFLEDVREKVKLHNGYDDLQKQLFSDILKGGDDRFIQYKNNFKDKRVLIVLDDVEERSQLNQIVGNRYRFGHGSRIIVTSRNINVFEQRHGDQIYKPSAMSFDDSLILFCKFAFRSTHLAIGYEDITRELVFFTAGLPLFHEVLGSLLFLKPDIVWAYTLIKLRSTQPDQVLERLKISYEELTHTEKQIFLDIACHFNGQDKSLPCYMWDDCGFSPTEGIEVLASLSLITIKEDNTIRMHDQLRELGRSIVQRENPRNSGKRSRLWDEEAVDVLKNQLGTELVETLSFQNYGYGSDHLTNDLFKGLSNLRYLQLEGSELKGDFMGLLPNLRWLRWKTWFSQKPLTNFSLNKLVILDLSGSDVSDGWESWIQIKSATNLKVLNLSYCSRITKTPDFSVYKNLERLILKGCGSLIEIGSSVMHLKRLIYFNASGCTHLRKLPLEFGSMTALKEVYFDFGSSIKELPDSIGLLVELQFLSLNDCRSLVDLPESLWNLKSLVNLDLSLTGIIELSKGIGNLANLRKILISYSRIRRLPDEIGKLVKLENLELTGCNIKELPDSIRMLAKLENLELAGCELEKLPESIGNLSNLRTLNLYGNPILELPDSIRMLAKLENLELAGCELEKLPESIGNLSNLRTLNLYGNPILELPDSIRMLAKLENLELAGCELEKLPESIGNLSNLRTLNLYGNPILELPDSIRMLAKLEKLELAGCELEKLPESIGNLCNLSVLNLCDMYLVSNLRCPIGHELPLSLTTLRIPFTEESLHGVARLVNLMILGFYSGGFMEPVKDPIDMSKLCKLRELELVGFDSVNLLSINYHTLSQLKAVRIIGYRGHKCLLDLSNLQMLIELTIKDCPGMTAIGNFGQLESLAYMEILDCASLEEIPDLSGLIRLNTLSIQRCRKLREIKGLVEALSSLEYLDLLDCPSLKNLPDLSNFKNLKVENIRIGSS